MVKADKNTKEYGLNPSGEVPREHPSLRRYTNCNRRRAMNKAPKKKEKEVLTRDDPEVKPDWEHECTVCGAKPILPLTGMCGPCTFGEAKTYGGNW